ncbi:MAG: tetratricopeptide repeat protein [Kofleriaceae bacterium]
MKHALLTAALVAVLSAPALAAPPPWADGVPEATQDQANAIYEEGNTLFAQQAHAPALEKYRAAIALWDHPRIRFNLAVTLIRLDRPLEAADELEKALRYGDAPFDKGLYQQALDYQALLKGRVGYVEATCSKAGAKATLDGKPWFDCPGTQKIRVMAGEHIVEGKLEGWVPATSGRVVVNGGSEAKVDIQMKSIESAVVIKYRYPRWLPFTITGTGLAVGIGGLFVYLSGRSQMNTFEDEFASACPRGCRSDLSDNTLLRDLRDGAELKGKIGIGLMIGGGAVTIAGAVMVIMNRGSKELPKLEVSPTEGGMTASTTFRF